MSTKPIATALCFLVAGWFSTGARAMAEEGAYGYYTPPPTYGYYPPPGDGGYDGMGVAPSFPGYGYSGYYQPTYYSPEYKPNQAVDPSPEPEPSPTPSPPESPLVGATRSLTECPTCPTCSTTSTSTSTTSATSQSALAKSAVEAPVAPTGQCYCPYDSDWDTWALDDSTCRAALKSKCQSDSRLPCTWVEAYYTDGTSSKSSTPPHAADLVAYLYNDCPPAPPCSCSVLGFTKDDSATLKYACCQDLQIYAATPYSALARPAVDAFCGRNGSPAAIQKWVQHALWHQNCTGKTTTGVYVYSAAALSSTPVQSASSQASSGTWASASGDGSSKTLAIAASAAGIGGAAVGALVAAAALTWWARRSTGPVREYNRLQGDTV